VLNQDKYQIIQKTGHDGAEWGGFYLSIPILNSHLLTCYLTHTWEIEYHPCFWWIWV